MTTGFSNLQVVYNPAQEIEMFTNKHKDREQFESKYVMSLNQMCYNKSSC